MNKPSRPAEQPLPAKNSNSRSVLAGQTECDFRNCLSSACFSSPDWVVPSAWIEHAPFAFWLVEATAPRTLVELGTHWGFSYLCFCQAVQAMGGTTVCHAIDTWKGDEHAGFYGEEVYSKLKEYHDAHYSAFSQLIRSSFDEAAAYFTPNSIDVLHIDGRHFYQDVKDDFETWAPKLSNRAVVLFHDINVRERGFGISQFWEELKARFPYFEFHHGNGLGILGLGEQLPLSLKSLFSATPQSTRRIRDAYARLGAGIAYREKLLALSEQVASLNAQSAAQNGTAASNRIAELEAEKVDLATQQKQLRLELEKHKLKAQVVDGRATQLELQTRELSRQLGAADAHAMHASRHIAALEAERVDLANRLAQLQVKNRELSELDVELKEAVIQRNATRRIFCQQAAIIGRLQQELRLVSELEAQNAIFLRRNEQIARLARYFPSPIKRLLKVLIFR